jgi:uracil-DNA glycosylase
MRKLSVTHDTEFRGRVQKLIASVFPLTHPSGLNRAGNFNTKNITQFETLEEIKE